MFSDTVFPLAQHCRDPEGFVGPRPDPGTAGASTQKIVRSETTEGDTAIKPDASRRSHLGLWVDPTPAQRSLGKGVQARSHPDGNGVCGTSVTAVAKVHIHQQRALVNDQRKQSTEIMDVVRRERTR